MSDQVIITIRDTTFQLPRQYFVSLQLDAGEKVRTEVCEVPSETPAFHKNQFTFWVHGGLSAEHNLTLGAFVVMEEGKEPQALGNCMVISKPALPEELQDALDAVMSSSAG